MAHSPAHKFGQIIGDLLEHSIEIVLREFTEKYPRLYLDTKGPRKVRKSRKKVSWTDKYGNSHDLDFVIEWDGSENKIGKPAAFIESAWRRYTKHSRNKAQEIQGAITPLFDTFENDCPFRGVILGGTFTEGSLTQLRSLGFEILYFDYDTIIDAFSVCGIDAFFDENTSDKSVQEKVSRYNALTAAEIEKIEGRIRKIKNDEINKFIDSLERTILRSIENIFIVALHGNEYQSGKIEDVIKYIEEYKPLKDSVKFVKFEIFIRYNNGDKVDAGFQDKMSAIKFLKLFQIKS